MAALAIVGVAVLMAALTVLAVRLRRSGRAGAAIGAAMAAYDEAMHSTAHDTFVEVRAQDERRIPDQAAGDPPAARRPAAGPR
jgi:hypothetical protein